MIMLSWPEANAYHVHHVFVLVCMGVTMLVDLGIVCMYTEGLLYICSKCESATSVPNVCKAELLSC